MSKQLKTIEEHIEISNFASVKSTAQLLLKKYGTDSYLQDRVGYLNYIVSLTE